MTVRTTFVCDICTKETNPDPAAGELRGWTQISTIVAPNGDGIAVPNDVSDLCPECWTKLRGLWIQMVRPDAA